MRQPMGKQRRMLHRLRGSEGDQTSDARSLVSWWIKFDVRECRLIVYHSYVSYVKWAYLVETHNFNLLWNTSIGVILLAHISISAKKMDQNTYIQQKCQTFLQQNSTTNITMEVFLHPFFFRLRKLGVLARCWWSLSVDLMSSWCGAIYGWRWVQVMHHWEGWGAKKQKMLWVDSRLSRPWTWYRLIFHNFKAWILLGNSEVVIW